MSDLSITLPDEDHFTNDDMTLIRRLRPADGMSFLRYSSDKGSCDQVAELVQGFGHRTLLVRMMQRGVQKIPPGHWVEQCVDRLQALLYAFGDYDVQLHVIPWNEVNLIDEEGGHKDFGRWGDYAQEFGNAWSTYASRFPLHLPAPSRQFTDDGQNESLLYWGAMKSSLHASGGSFVYKDVHAYGNDFFVAQAEASMAGPELPLWVTESNRMPMAWVRDSTAVGVVWFTVSWRQYNDQGGVDGNRIIPGMTIDTDLALQEEYLHRNDVEQAPDAPTPEPAPEPVPTTSDDVSSSWTRERVIQFCVDRANEVGLPPIYVLGGAIAESGLNVRARRPENPADDEDYWPDVSGGLWQQTIRWDPAYTNDTRFGTFYPGFDAANEFLERYYDPEQAWATAAPQLIHWYQQEDGNALNALSRYNIPTRDPVKNPNRENYGRGLAEATSILGAPEEEQPVPEPVLTYNPDTPLILQQESWTCSIRSLQMALASLGHEAEYDVVQKSMAGIVDPSLGLHYADGHELEQLVHEWGHPNTERIPWQAGNGAGASYDDVLARAGECPQLMGGQAWNHWIFVRRELANGDLELGNPAPGWKDSTVQQSLNRRQFDQLGPMTLIRILPDVVESEEAPTVTAELQEKVNGLVSALAYVCDDIGDTLAKPTVTKKERLAATNEMRRIRAEQVGPRP